MTKIYPSGTSDETVIMELRAKIAELEAEIERLRGVITNIYHECVSLDDNLKGAE